MLGADTVVGAVEPSLHVGKQDTDNRHEALSVCAIAVEDRVLPVGAVKPGIALEIVADDVAFRPDGGAHEAAQLMGVGERQDGEPRPWRGGNGVSDG